MLQVLFGITLLLFCLSLYFLWRNKKVADFRLYLIHLVFLNNVLEKRADMFDFNTMFPSYERMLYTPRSLNYWLKTCGKDLRLTFIVQKSVFSSKHIWSSIQEALDYTTMYKKNRN